MKAAGRQEKQHATVEMELEMENINCQICIWGKLLTTS